MDLTRVYNADCLPKMREFPDKWFDLAIVDPPYGETCNLDGGTGKQNGFREYWDKANGNSNWNTAPKGTYFTELLRISKNQIVWGGNHLAEFLPSSSGWVFWDKGQRDFSFSDGELAFTSFNVKLRAITIHRQELQTERRIHPTQKPVKLYKWLLKNYAKEGDKILDTHGGSMSSVIACLDMGFPITCFELDTDYYNQAKNRITNHLKQLSAFRPAYDIEFHDNNGVSQLRDNAGIGYQEQTNGKNKESIHRIDGLFYGDAK